MSGLFSDPHHVREQLREHFLLLQRGRQRCTVDHGPPHLSELDFQKTVGGDFPYQIQRTKEGNPVFDQSPHCTRKLRVVAVANDSSVSRNQQPKTVPSDTSFLAAQERAKTNDSANDCQTRSPPIPSDQMVNLQQDSRRQWKRATSLCHETGQLWHHERDENRNKNGASQREKCRINQGLLHAIPQVFCLHQMLDQPKQNLRQRAARFACGHQVYIQWRENSRHLAQRLRETATID